MAPFITRILWILPILFNERSEHVNYINFTNNITNNIVWIISLIGNIVLIMSCIHKIFIYLSKKIYKKNIGI